MKLGDELRFVLLTSNVKVVSINEKSSDAKDTELSGLSLLISHIGNLSYQNGNPHVRYGYLIGFEI